MSDNHKTAGAPGWRELRQARIERERALRKARTEERMRRRERPSAAEAPAREQPARSGKASAITTRAALHKQRGGIERATAWLVLLISFLGSIVALHGGWPAFIASLTAGPFNLGALLGGFLIQLLLTFLEWWYSDRWSIAWSARIVDAATTSLGYGPLFLAPLMAWLHDRSIESPSLAAWGIIGIISLGVAWYPENRLID